MNQSYLEKLAHVAVRSGVNIQKGQRLVVNSSIEQAPLARLVVKEAYDAGAKEVIVNFSDPDISRETFLRADEDIFSKAPSWHVTMMNETSQDGAAFMTILDADPDALTGVDPNRIVNRQKANAKELSGFNQRLMSGQNAWTAVAAASKKWAKKVYPELAEEDALEALWNDIFYISRIDENDPKENWKKHNVSFENRINKLNEYKFEKFHYQNGAGTDLWVEMPDNHVFLGGGQAGKNGVFYFPNIPTEEVFSAPKRDGVNGTLVSTMPLNLNGSLVKDIVFTFKDGKIVDAKASSGLDLLLAQIDMDEGARYLGEIALVPYGSPIQSLNRLFYNTLIDENASCHFAFGKAYPDSIAGGEDMSEEEMLAHGLNVSHNHVDFMVGSDDLTITGYTKEGKEVPVFVNGRFSAEFDGQ